MMFSFAQLHVIMLGRILSDNYHLLLQFANQLLVWKVRWMRRQEVGNVSAEIKLRYSATQTNIYKDGVESFKAK
jgi:hypothetical protein